MRKCDSLPREFEHAYKVIRPDRIHLISYPYEWSFSQYQDAALLTLEIQRLALGRGMSLKDCSAFNVQFHEGRPIFIDTLSLRAVSGREAMGGLPPVLPAFSGPSGPDEPDRHPAQPALPHEPRRNPPGSGDPASSLEIQASLRPVAAPSSSWGDAAAWPGVARSGGSWPVQPDRNAGTGR